MSHISCGGTKRPNHVTKRRVGYNRDLLSAGESAPVVNVGDHCRGYRITCDCDWIIVYFQRYRYDYCKTTKGRGKLDNLTWKLRLKVYTTFSSVSAHSKSSHIPPNPVVSGCGVAARNVIVGVDSPQ